MEEGQPLDADESARRRDEAIERVERNSPEEIKEFLLSTVFQVAKSQSTVFCDDVWERVPDSKYPSEPRVFGAIMRQAARHGWVAPTDEYRESARPSVHRNPKRVWKSLIFPG